MELVLIHKVVAISSVSEGANISSCSSLGKVDFIVPKSRAVTVLKCDNNNARRQFKEAGSDNLAHAQEQTQFGLVYFTWVALYWSVCNSWEGRALR